jgi:hypothetical protein
MSPAADWLCAIDDGMRGLPSYCTVCGGRQGQGWWDVAEVHAITVAIKVCDRCRALDPQRHVLRALLAQRYVKEGQL